LTTKFFHAAQVVCGVSVVMTNELPGESRPSSLESLVLTPTLSCPRFAVTPSSGVIHTPGVPAVSFTPFLISRLDSQAPYISFCLLPRSTVVSLAALRCICASVDGATHARRRARRLAYIVSARDGPGGLPSSLLVLYRSGSVNRLTLWRLPNGSRYDCLTGKIR